MDNDTGFSMPECHLSEATLSATTTLRFLSFKVVTPIVSLIGGPFYAFILVVLLRETSNEGAYIYQVLLTCGKAMETLTSVLMTYSFYGAGLGSDGVTWYKRSYFLMFYTAHLSSLALQFAQFLSLYLAAFMSVDRLLALSRPVAYHLQNRYRQVTVAVVVSVSVAAVCSVYNAWIFKLELNDDGVYDAVSDLDFAFGKGPIVFSSITMVLRIFGVLTLLVSNMMLVYYFRFRFVKSQPLLSTVNGEKEQRRKSKERPLFLFTFWQSACCCLAETEQAIFSSLITYFAYFQCYSGVLTSLDSILLLIINFLEAFLPFAFNQHLRSVAGTMFYPKRLTVNVEMPCIQMA